jgi:hypothetical protein
MSPLIDGNHVIYHYLQKMVAARDDNFSRAVIERLVIDLSIWLPPALYKSFPILLPFCVRDPSCRSSGPHGEDEWGSADSNGYLRDDNSLLKATAPHLEIASPRFPSYHGGRATKGFVASHVWRGVLIDGHEILSSRHPRLYSFVPNVCWLPVQISKLTDRERSHAQQVLQVLSHRIYSPHRAAEPPELAVLWNALPCPALKLEIDVSTLNYFCPTEAWIIRRKRQLRTEIDCILAVIGHVAREQVKIKCSRYLPSLINATQARTSDLQDWLRRYTEIAEL